MNEESNYAGTAVSSEDFEEIENAWAVINPTPDNPPWFSGIAILTWLASILFIAVFPALFFLPYLYGRLNEFADFSDAVEKLQFDPTAVLLQIISVIPAHLATLLLAWLVITRNRKFSFRKTLGWDAKSFKWSNYLILIGGIYVLGVLIEKIFPAQENQLEKMLQLSNSILYVVAFLATFTAPLVEEVIYRGILYSAFQRSLGVPKAVLMTTALFALVHVPQYYPSFTAILLICLLSLILTLIRAKTKNLLPCIIFHTIFNGIQSIVLVASTFQSKAPIIPSHSAAFITKWFW